MSEEPVRHVAVLVMDLREMAQRWREADISAIVQAAADDIERVAAAFERTSERE
jgi:hypothetical protein